MPHVPAAALTTAAESVLSPALGRPLAASMSMMLSGGSLVALSAPTFVVGNWLIMAAGCTLVHALAARPAS